jgi:autotransporter-associated beta strand protein
MNVTSTSGTPTLTVSGTTLMGSANSANVNQTIAPSSGVSVILGAVTGIAPTAGSAHVNTLILDGTTTGNQINGTISDILGTVAAQSAITKSNSSTWTLSGTGSYTGATAINGGTLIMGDADTDTFATSGVTAASGATLAGSGTIGGATSLQSGGVHAAGNGVGIQKFTNNLTYQDGSIFSWEIAKTHLGAQTRGTDYDAVNVTGTLAGLDGADVGSTTDAIFRVVIGDADFSDAFWASNDHSWSDIFTAANGTTAKADWKNIFGGGFQYYKTDGSILSAPTTGSFGWSGANNNTLTWTFTAVPEPTSALAGLLITAGLLRRRRIA